MVPAAAAATTTTQIEIRCVLKAGTHNIRIHVMTMGNKSARANEPQRQTERLHNQTVPAFPPCRRREESE